MCDFLSKWYLNINKEIVSLPSLGKVSPVSHDYCAQHDVVLGEVTVEQISGTHHGHAKHIGHLHTQIHTHAQAQQLNRVKHLLNSSMEFTSTFNHHPQIHKIICCGNSFLHFIHARPENKNDFSVVALTLWSWWQNKFNKCFC